MRSNWQCSNAKISVYDLAQQVRDRMSGSSANLTDGQVEEECERVVLASCEGIASYRRLTELVRFVFCALRCELEILQDMADDPDVTEIMVNGPDSIFLERGGKTVRADLSFETEERLTAALYLLSDA